MRRITSLMAVLVLVWLPVIPAAAPQNPAGIDYKLQSQELTTAGEKPGYEVHSEPERALEEYEQITDEELQQCRSDYYLLAKMAMAEAESEDLYGKAAVVKVALNRLESPQFPDTLQEVIYQPGQFSCIQDGRYAAAEPNEDCYLAVEIVLEGWDEVGGALYFERSGNPDSWHAQHLDYIVTIGRHDFYR